MITVRRISIAIAVAIVLNLIVFAIGSAVGATWLANGQTIVWFLVVVATIIPMAVGAVLTWLLTKRWSDAGKAMAWIGLVLAIITVPAPLLASDDRPTGMALAAMHVVTGIVWFIAIRPRRVTVA